MKVKKRIKRLGARVSTVTRSALALSRENGQQADAIEILQSDVRKLDVQRVDLQRQLKDLLRTNMATGVNQEWAERIQRLERITDSLASTRLARDIGKELNHG